MNLEQLRKSFFTAIQGFCSNSKLNSRRSRNLEALCFEEIAVDYKFAKDNIGIIFPFQGRHQESGCLYEYLYKQEFVREAAFTSIQQDQHCRFSNWETFKRFEVPVCMSISGIGKTKWAQRGLFKHVHGMTEQEYNNKDAGEQRFIDMLRSDGCCHLRIGECINWFDFFFFWVETCSFSCLTVSVFSFSFSFLSSNG